MARCSVCRTSFWNSNNCPKCGAQVRSSLGQPQGQAIGQTSNDDPGTQATQAINPRWEYKVEKISMGGMVDPNIDQVNDNWLNAFGSEGWELAFVVPMTRGGGLTVAEYLIFKRMLL